MKEIDFGGDYFLPKQIEYVWTPDDGRLLDIALYLGGVGSGKTWSSARKGFLISQLYPGSRGFVGAEDYPLVRDTTWGGDGGWKDFMENELELKEGFHFSYNKNEHLLTFPNKSEVLFRGLRDAGKIKSLTLTWAHIEEASDIDLASFLQLLGRLRQSAPPGWEGLWRRFLFLSTNPEENPGWINDIFLEAKDNEEWTEKQREKIWKIRSAIRVIHAPTSENTRLPEDYIDTMEALADEDWIAVYVHGMTGGLGKGRAYKQFKPADHVRDDLAVYRPELPIRLSLDFNVSPMSACIHQVLPGTDREIITIDEISIKDSTTEELCSEFLRRYASKTGNRPHKGGVIVYGDAAGNSRSTKATESDYDIVKRALRGQFTGGVSFKIPDANGAVKTRVNCCNARFRNAKGDVRWFIHSRCKELRMDLERVKWKEGTTELDKRDPARTHMSDAAGYFVVWEFPIADKPSVTTIKQLQALQGR